ncbi:MAG: ribosome biogenesis GTPase Der [Dehalococcoidales bacterium]|nr:ribosome biogenesis GTPase Der [Dehalococcoidales bacterium]
MSKSVVAIIGRQNVGKSTLLNRLAGKRIAIVEDFPGTTRDRVFADVSWEGKEFTLVDTGGLELGMEKEIDRGVKEQIKMAMAEADAIVFMVDVKDGIMPADLEIADLVRRLEKPALLVANKGDNEKLEAQAVEFYQLGLGEPFVISAYHGRSTAELIEKIITLLPAPSQPVAEPEMMKVAIVGRPNVGKSMLLNAILGRERVIVSDVPGTTRDAIDTQFDLSGKNVLLIDTAGIRKRGQVDAGIEYFSVLRSLRAIDRCDVALLILDASTNFAAQDMHIAGYIRQALKGIVIVVNKWDTVTDENQDLWAENTRKQFKFVSYAPALFVSAKFKTGIDEVLPLAYRVYQERMKQVPEVELRGVIQDALASHNMPRKGKVTLAIKEVAQTAVNPPVFTFKVNDASLVHFSFRRFLENRLREAFGFTGTPLNLVFKTGGES